MSTVADRPDTTAPHAARGRLRQRHRAWPAASAATRSSSARTTPVRSASARSRSPTTSRPSPARRSRPARATSGATRRCCRCPTDIEQSPNTEPGFTRLLKADNLGRELGIDNLWVKDDSTNPTNSFKDRVVACALSAAREFGSQGLRLPLAPATSPTRSPRPAPGPASRPSSSSRATSSSPSRSTPPSTPSTLVAVNGNYDDVNKLASEIAGEEEGWAFVNVNVRPYYAEGSKTLGYEIAEQLGWRLPDQIVIPVASGSQLTKVDKAFQELITLGLVEDKPYKVYGAQATGCSPVSVGLQGRRRRDPPGQARHHRQVPGDRQPRRRHLRARHLPAHRRRGRGHHRRRGPRRHPAAGPHRGHLHRDRRRHHGRRAEEARRDRPARPRPSRPSSSTPAWA